MKKAALLLTILCLVLSTTGCTSSSGRNQKDSTGTLYSTKNTEKDDNNAPSTRTPEPDICSVCNDEGYLDCEVCGHKGFTECDLCSGEGRILCAHFQEKPEQPSNQASGGGTERYDNGIYENPISTPSWSYDSSSHC